MEQWIDKTGKTIEEAFRAALAEIGKQADEVRMEVVEEPSKGFFGLIGAKPARVRVIYEETTCAKPEAPASAASAEAAPVPAIHESSDSTAEKIPLRVEPPPEEVEAAMARGKALLEQIFQQMHLDVQITRKDKEEGHIYDLAGEDLGILIGKHGQTLDALQYLTNLAANRGLIEAKVRIILDVENYRERREETLCRLAAHLAEKCVRTGEKIVLEPMNRHERKIIHTTLQENHAILTYSSGDEPYRKVVIEPKRGIRRRNRSYRSYRSDDRRPRYGYRDRDADYPRYRRDGQEEGTGGESAAAGYDGHGYRPHSGGYRDYRDDLAERSGWDSRRRHGGYRSHRRDREDDWNRRDGDTAPKEAGFSSDAERGAEPTTEGMTVNASTTARTDTALLTAVPVAERSKEQETVSAES